MAIAPSTPPLNQRQQTTAAPLTQPDAITVLSSSVDAAVRNPQRLEALRRTQLLQTPPEESFDRLTRLAAKLVGVPVTFISLVDEGSDFYKSCFGFGEPLSSTRTLEGRTFCHYTLVRSGPLLIPDTMADPQFADVPTVKSLGVRAYAGIPLVTDDGEAIGSFCAIDFAPREWTPLDVEILTELAASALREIKLRGALADSERQARRAQEATRSREQVLAVVAHDLRTPLNFLRMGTQLVGEDCGTAENRELVRRMESAVEQMSRLIDDLLEVAKMEAGGVLIRKREVAAETLLNDAVAMLKPLAARHGIELVVNAPAGLPSVQADYERVLRVFSNLVVNAVKFSREGSEVRLDAEHRGSVVCFSVIDRGEGIPEEQLSRLFDPFWQADRADRRGAGLGLAIAKGIVTAHGGTISVSSKVGEGSEFHFELPVA
jgi:signal transduction histidine kinase